MWAHVKQRIEGHVVRSHCYIIEYKLLFFSAVNFEDLVCEEGKDTMLV